MTTPKKTAVKPAEKAVESLTNSTPKPVSEEPKTAQKSPEGTELTEILTRLGLDKSDDVKSQVKYLQKVKGLNPTGVIDSEFRKTFNV